MKITIPAKTIEISRCYHECPYFSLDGGPSPTMYCGHPFWKDKGAYAGAIIRHPVCDEGFPSACPLVYPKAAEESAELYKQQEKSSACISRLTRPFEERDFATITADTAAAIAAVEDENFMYQVRKITGLDIVPDKPAEDQP